MQALLKRFNYDDKQTLGSLTLFDGMNVLYSCYTLELPDLCNAKRKSCIPAGIYNVEIRRSKRFKLHFHITNVENRDFILIHAGNYFTDILGCVLVGRTLKDINKDGYRDVTSSRKTLKKLLELAPDGFELEII